jgi:hypothetical protein
MMNATRRQQIIFIINRRRKIFTLLMMKRRRRRRQILRRFWVHPIFVDRGNFGLFHHLYPQLLCHPDKFREVLRMPVETFKRLENLLMPRFVF